MFHLTMFSGTEAALQPGAATVLTLFGATVLSAPTLALRLSHYAQRRQQKATTMDVLLGRDRSMFVTLFGATEVLLPSLVDEYAALQQMVAQTPSHRTQLRELANELAHSQDCGLRLSTLTLFGGCSIKRPSAKRQAAALERAQKTGEIDAPLRAALERLVGRAEPEVVRGLAGLALV